MTGRRPGNNGTTPPHNKNRTPGSQMRASDARQPLHPPRDPPNTPNKPTGKSPENPKGEDSRNILKILAKLDGLDNKIEQTNDHLTQRIDDNIAKTDQLTEKFLKVKDESTGLKVQASVHGVRLSELETRIEKLEREKRRTTVVIDGVKEEEGEETAEIVDEIFEDIGVGFSTKVVINIHRRGCRVTADSQQGKQRPEGPPRYRPIIVVFSEASGESRSIQKAPQPKRER